MKKQKKSVSGKKAAAKTSRESEGQAPKRRGPRSSKKPSSQVEAEPAQVAEPEPAVGEEPRPSAPGPAEVAPGAAEPCLDRGDTPAERAAEGAIAAAETNQAAGGTPAVRKVRERDSRLPSPGTLLQRRDRQGQVRCECVVLESGVNYAGAVYRSLSAAAVAASKDLGGRGTSANGFSFWGLTKVARKVPPRDPHTKLGKRWDSYQALLEGALETCQGEQRQALLDTLERHARVLRNLHDEASEARAIEVSASA